MVKRNMPLMTTTERHSTHTRSYKARVFGHGWYGQAMVGDGYVSDSVIDKVIASGMMHGVNRRDAAVAYLLNPRSPDMGDWQDIVDGDVFEVIGHVTLHVREDDGRVLSQIVSTETRLIHEAGEAVREEIDSYID